MQLETSLLVLLDAINAHILHKAVVIHQGLLKMLSSDTRESQCPALRFYPLLDFIQIGSYHEMYVEQTINHSTSCEHHGSLQHAAQCSGCRKQHFCSSNEWENYLNFLLSLFHPQTELATQKHVFTTIICGNLWHTNGKSEGANSRKTSRIHGSPNIYLHLPYRYGDVSPHSTARCFLGQAMTSLPAQPLEVSASLCRVKLYSEGFWISCLEVSIHLLTWTFE